MFTMGIRVLRADWLLADIAVVTHNINQITYIPGIYVCHEALQSGTVCTGVYRLKMNIKLKVGRQRVYVRLSDGRQPPLLRGLR